MASLDLADAYYSIPVAEEDRKFLRLRWGGGGSSNTILFAKWASAGPEKFH